MKLKTALSLVTLVMAAIAIILFLSNSHNNAILTQEFQFLGMSFSVIKGIVLVALIAAITPSILFSLKYMRAAAYAKNVVVEHERDQTSRDDNARVHALYHHGCYREVLSLLEGKNDPASTALKARAHLSMGQREAALPLLKKAFGEHGDTAMGYLLVDTLNGLGRSPESTLNALIESDPDHARRARQRLLEFYDREKMWASCLESLDALAKLGVEVPLETRIAYQCESIQADKELPLKKKIERFQQLLKKKKTFVPAHLALGDAYLEAEQEEKAFHVFEQAFEATGNPIFLQRFEHYYLESGRPEDAIQIYRELMVRIGGPLIKYQLGKLYHKLEMTDESLEILEPLAGTLEHIPGYRYHLAVLKAKRHRIDEAVENFKQMALAQDLDKEGYLCKHCGAAHETWRTRCPRCNSWGTITSPAGLVTREAIPANPISY